MIQGKRRGFDPGKPGTLYVLQSECGTMIKIGISNKPDQRVTFLAHWTPFRVRQVATIRHSDGAQIAQLEKDLHAKMTRVNLSGRRFYGYTEWMEWDDQLPRWLYECATAGFAVSVAAGISGAQRNGRPLSDEEFDQSARYAKPHNSNSVKEAHRKAVERLGSLFGR